MPYNTLKRQEMLKSREKLKALFLEGKHISVPPFKLLFIVGKKPDLLLHNTDNQAPVFEAEPGKRQVADISFQTDFSPRPYNIQVGMGAGKKYFKKAVDRNRIKRLMREAYRLQKQPLHGLAASKNLELAIFFMFTGKTLPTFGETREKTGVLLAKLIQRFK